VTRSSTVACILLALWLPAAASAQGQFSTLALETTAAVDHSFDEDGNLATNLVFDGVASAALNHGLQAIVRPFLQRSASGEWNRQIWMAALRYERAGSIGVRIDAGLIASPVGLASLTLRPHLNPTISQPASLFTPLPAADLQGTRTNLIGPVYPLGGQLTLSQLRWDVRAAVIDTSPVRPRRVFSPANPPRFPTVVVGAGVTPVIGLRIGASVARGGWLNAGESPSVTRDRDATVVAIESEFSFRFTKLSGEWVRDTLETENGRRAYSGWFLQGQQALGARWFVAGRIERMAGPLVLADAVEDQRFDGFEETLGFRLTRELTLRAGHRARRGFGRAEYEHLAAVSLVWWRRWM
jgi:hypothetical protein